MKTFFIFVLLLNVVLQAQITIDGTITDSDANPISDAVVEIIDQNDTSNNYSSGTNETGYFTISNITDIPSRKTNVPSEFIVLRNYPNPFNPTTIIYYELPRSENIEIKIYDILGREVRTLYNSYHKSGVYTLEWDGRNNWNSPVAAGIYFCRLKTKDQFKVHKMILLDGGSTSSSATSSKVNKEKHPTITKASSTFNYSLRITGSDILESEFKYLSCSGDTTINLMVPKILKSATIGPEGGKLETEDFSLFVPTGAFTEIVKIDLSIDPNDISFSENSGSPLFIVEGIPEIINQNLFIGIKYLDLNADTIFAAVGERSIDWGDGEEANYFDVKPTFDSLNYQYFEISPSYYNPRRLKKALLKVGEYRSNSKLILKLLKDYSYASVDILTLFYPKKYSEIIPAFAKLLLEVPVAFSKTLFSEGQTYQNVGVFIMDIPGYFAKSLKYVAMPDYDVIQVNEKFFNESSFYDIRREYAHLYYYTHIFTKSSDPEETYKKGLNNWFNEDPHSRIIYHAIATWSEELFEPKSIDFVPNCFWGNELRIFNGLFSGTKINSLVSKEYEDGYSLAALIKYLVKIGGLNLLYRYHIVSTGVDQDKVPIRFFENIRSSSSDVISENIWLPDFYKEYIQGNIYNVPSEKFLNNITETVEFNDGDTLKHADETYNDLSAKLFEIKINSDEIKNKKSLRFKLGPESLNLDYIKTLVFGITDDNIIYLEGGDDFLVGNLSAYKGLLACVVNSGNEAPYTGTSNINLDVKVSKDPAFHHCDIKIRVYTPQDSSYWDPWWWTDGSFKDNVYTGKINSELQGGAATGSIQVVVDDHRNILSLSVMASSDYEGFKSEWGLTAANVFPTSESPYAIDYKYYGTDVCIYVPSIYAKYTETDGSSYELNQRNCDENSVLEIKFHNWR